MKQKIAVIGGGASGVFAAIFAALNGAEVTIIEHQDRILKKILLTGNGKCNLTNYEIGPECYKTDSQNFQLVEETLKKVTPNDLVSDLKNMGLPVKVLRDSYVYPFTESASTVVNVLLRQIKKYKIKVCTNTTVSQLTPEKGGFFIVTDSFKFHVDKVICAVGGKSYVKTGSDGSFYKYLDQLKIPFHSSYPVLTAMNSSRPNLKTLSGLRMDGKATLYIGGNIMASDEGQIQLTDYGISGIPVFQISKEASYELHQKKHKDVCVYIDFFPKLDASELTAMLMDQFNDYAGLSVEEALIGIFPKKFLDYILKDQKLNGMKANDVTFKQTKSLVHLCKEFDFPITGVKGYEFSQVTGGGIDLNALNEEFMLKKYPGFYATGEVLDLTGICGGYNLHFAFASGKIAGTAAAKG